MKMIIFDKDGNKFLEIKTVHNVDDKPITK